ncbi:MULTISPECIES: 50S ribosomal protein L30 [Thiocapsa]|jgi:large subunit ribosomal protein L30|uniref:Large ribosomal subunit protein uL30 n=2 Tax=Thiocapsa TaxID=1056 RepID=F9U5R1_9GAMM|nr:MULTISPECIES: 50S ribosomal protein L30 [Thiocapsa]EGV20484.1 ribosomal protein L30 [Thiocapsa marina 5811]NCC30172.1 50S ribosomal protein L30 [Gammaproteobacteria bacterium]RKT42876.1 LSU ribosomal protein L30P [Thiocapsa rosea]HSO81058.1 50S ribosomal protein L30 [Thiocapsa sp.]
MADKKMMKVKLVRSVHGRLANHKACVRGLGLRRMNHVVEVEDTPCTRGMVNTVSYMVSIVEESRDAAQ